MTDTTTRQNPLKSLKLLAPIVVGAGVLLAGAWAVSYVKQEKPYTFVSFFGLPEGSQSNVTVTSSAGYKVYDGAAFTPPAAPYRINAAIKLPGDHYRDFAFTVSKDRGLSAVADGFHAGDIISLTINQGAPVARLPADWSGKLQLDIALPAEETVEACMQVSGKTESVGFCHTLPERRPS